MPKEVLSAAGMAGVIGVGNPQSYILTRFLRSLVSTGHRNIIERCHETRVDESTPFEMVDRIIQESLCHVPKAGGGDIALIVSTRFR